MSRLFMEFYFKDQAEFPDCLPTTKAEISSCASGIKRLSSAIDSCCFGEDDWADVLTDISKEAVNIYDDVDGIIGGEDYYNYSQELEEILETQLIDLWDLEDHFISINEADAAEAIAGRRSYRPRYRSSKAILNDHIFRYTKQLFEAFPDAKFCVSLEKLNVIVEEKTQTHFRCEDWSYQNLRVVSPSTKELNAFQDYYNPTLNEIVLFEIEFNKEYPLRKMCEHYKPEIFAKQLT